MANAPTADFSDSEAASALERQLRDINEALLVSSVRQHELAAELTRFNRAAVGRESRMIELKTELNALRLRHGYTAPYPLELEDSMTAAAELLPSKARIRTLRTSRVPLETILFTDELGRRPSRPADYARENRALATVVQTLADAPGTVLRVLAEKIMETLQAGSAGISLLTNDGERFYWAAIAGAWRAHVGEGTPRDFGPCGDVLDRKRALLFKHPERRYDDFLRITPPATEALVVPFYVDGEPSGTIWVVAHDDHEFDAEDLRQLEGLGRLASAAYQTVQLRELEHSRSVAALNLMEDAVQSRHATEQINAELRESEERYRTLFNSIDEGFCVIEVIFNTLGESMDYRFLITNPGFEKQTGLNATEGKRMRELVPNLEPQWYERFGNVARTGEPVRFVNQAKELDGRWFDVYAFRLGDAESRKVAIFFTDITIRRLLEERTNEQGKSLADLNRRKDEFLAMLSHELRNPLASIVNAIQLLRLQKDRNSLQVEADGMIDRQVAQLARLVDDLLEVSRISTGRIHLQEERVDLRGIVQRATETTEAQARKKGHTIATSLPPGLVCVQGDPVRLEQIVVNLLNNASKYTDYGGDISVTLSEEGNDAVLSVRDNGMGIAPEMLPRIFELFTQADKSLGHSQGGLGIGLALVRALVTLHRGSIETHSTLGKGSEFIVRLPVFAPVHKVAVPPVVERRKVPRPRRVLVVDDNVDAANSVAMLLRAYGHEAVVTHDGTSALQVALEYIPEVVLLDVGLPSVSGLQVAKWIRNEPVLRDVVLVALTGYGQQSDKDRSREAGFDYHLVKPVDFATVANILAAPRNDSGISFSG